ncbi:hypothetical protein MML48_1g04668 [Holotrichia oblita]|uniref:Uncharacterized protein n=1 Tax=Holotrichia oblita TaxID=644536 RepID=A0ACB9TT05_HOLOL|nr:hypothetical protein MML48_1g04668 [Holotrichia oblita]
MHLLLHIFNSKKNVIENKKTDAVSNADKEAAWKDICTEFNALSPANIYRDMTSLKKMYMNMKKVVRKEVADEKMEIFKTGGGPSCTKVHNPLKEITLETINAKTVTGLDNIFDGDNCTETDIDLANSNISNATEEMETIYIMGEASTSQSQTWNKWKSDNLKLPVSSPLKRKAAEEDCPKSSRRRPAATTALNSSNLSKLYSDLAEQRLDCVQLEKNILEKKNKWMEEKHKIKKQILEVQLQLKLEELKKLNPDWVDTFRKNL